MLGKINNLPRCFRVRFLVFSQTVANTPNIMVYLNTSISKETYATFKIYVTTKH